MCIEFVFKIKQTKHVGSEQTEFKKSNKDANC